METDKTFREIFYPVPDINSNFKKLKIGRIIGWITDEYYAIYQIKTNHEYQELKMERLRREIKIGLDQIERGEVSDGEAFFDELEKEMDN